MIPLREEEDTDKNNKNYSKKFSIWPYQLKIEQETLLIRYYNKRDGREILEIDHALYLTVWDFNGD
jgi:hypothetical protein